MAFVSSLCQTKTKGMPSKKNQKYTFKSKFVNWEPLGAIHNGFVKNNPKGKNKC